MSAGENKRINTHFEEQIMKFKIEEDKLQMEIKIEDLVWLFNTSANNFDGMGQIGEIKSNKEKEFVNFIIQHLLDENKDNGNISNWAEPLERIFEEILEGYEDFCEYKEGER